MNITGSEDSTCQQAFEALTILIALRCWSEHWSKCRACVAVNADNLSSLQMVANMQPHSASLGVVAREMALDIADAVYSPDLAAHLPGVANVTADALSRFLSTW